MARPMPRGPTLAVVLCALAAATSATIHANTRLLTYGTQLQQAQLAMQRAQLAQQQAQMAQQQAYAQPQAYYGAVPIPLQRYMYINGQPYAVLDQNIQYVEPQAQAASPPAAQVYAAPAAPVAPVAPEAPAAPVAPEAPAAPADTADTYAAAPDGGTTVDQEQPPVDTAAAANDGKAVDTETVVPKGTVAEGDTSAAPAAPQGAAAPPAAAAPAAPAAPAAAVAPTSYGAGPALVATPNVYLSSSSTPGLIAEGPITMTVGNPKVTVHRTVTQYTSQEPPRAVPRDVVITFTRNGQAAPIRVPIINGYSAPFRAEHKTEPTLVKTTSTWTVPGAAGDKPSAGTLVPGLPPAANRPSVTITSYSQQVAAPGGPAGLRKVFEDPVTRRAYYSDAAGRMYDASGSPLIMEPTASAAPAAPAPPAPADVRPTYWGSLRELGTPSAGPESGSGTAPTGNVREDYKQDGMTALLRMYTPTTYQPVPPPSNYEQPLRVAISTGRGADAAGQDAVGPASPPSPDDSKPSRGDSW